jgi:dTDP-4-dehydrorhamnose reductase
MKIHILGSKGMLGGYLVKYLTDRGHTVESYDRTKLEVYNFDPYTFYKKLKSTDLVVNCVGLLKPCITSLEQSILVNKNFPMILDIMCAKVGCNLINFSSDCVFSGTKGKYIESDECDATDIYGITKCHDFLQSTVIRTSFIGEEKYNKRGLLEFALKNKNSYIHGYKNCLWNGVTALEIAKLIEKMVYGKIKMWKGVRHVFSNRILSKSDLLKIIDETYNLKLTIEEITADSISKTHIIGVLDRSLSTIHDKIEAPTIEEMIYEQKEFKL